MSAILLDARRRDRPRCEQRKAAREGIALGSWMDCASRLARTGQRIADPSDDSVPLSFFVGRIVEKDAIHNFSPNITAVVLDLALANARYSEKARRYFSINDASRRILSCQEGGWGQISDVREGLGS